MFSFANFTICVIICLVKFANIWWKGGQFPCPAQAGCLPEGARIVVNPLSRRLGVKTANLPASPSNPPDVTHTGITKVASFRLGQ